MHKRMYDGEAVHFAFNIWDLASAQAVMDASRNMGQDVILQTSTNIYLSVPQKELRQFVTSYAGRLGINVWLNLDHCRDEEIVRDAIDNGWDSVMLDMSEKSLAENIEAVNRLRAYAETKEQKPYIEAEVGVLQGTEEDISSIEGLIASKEDIDVFSEQAGFDALAVAFGNAHGTYKAPPNLHYELVEYALEKSRRPFVVHGASGLREEEIGRLISIKGVRKVNISTDLKLAALQGYREAEQKDWLNEKGFQPVRVQQSVSDAVRRKAEEKMSMLKGAR